MIFKTIYNSDIPPSTHRSSLVYDFLENHGTLTVTQPPYSPDLAPADYFLFPKLKMRLKNQQFQVVEDIKKESLRYLTVIPKSTYEKCYQSWTERWWKCITRRGYYFEGDSVL